jgi:hypothetical protein
MSAIEPLYRQWRDRPVMEREQRPGGGESLHGRRNRRQTQKIFFNASAKSLTLSVPIPAAAL